MATFNKRWHAAKSIADTPGLICLSGPIKGKRFCLKGVQGPTRFLVGSHRSADVWIAGSTILARHAAIEWQGGEWAISVLSPEAPLKVNGEPVLTAVIEEGDTLQIGRHFMRFTLRADGQDGSESGPLPRWKSWLAAIQ